MKSSSWRSAATSKPAPATRGSRRGRCRRLGRAVLLASALVHGAAALAAGDVWSFEDGDGVTHFSNVPDNPRYRLLVKGPERVAGDSGPARAKPTRLRSLIIGELPFAAMVAAAASEQRLDPALLHAIIHVESRHNPAALSHRGAVGLMQVLPATARRMGIERIDTPAANIDAGARYLRFLLDIFERDVPLALAAYNAGENAVLRFGRQIPPYPETRAYVPAVIAAYQQLRQPTP